MLPQFITFTGADRADLVPEMRELAKDYPIEWGILFSPARQGKSPRYPAGIDLFRIADGQLRLSAHLCGGHSRRVMLRQEVELPVSWDVFGRVPLQVGWVVDFCPKRVDATRLTAYCSRVRRGMGPREAGGTAMDSNEIMGVAAALKAACGAIAGVCNGAITRDDVGFNKADTSFGRFIATVPAERWDAEQCAVVRDLLRKYKGQLAAAGIEWAALPAVQVVAAVETSRKGALARFKAQQADLDADAEAEAWRAGRIGTHELVFIRQRPRAWVEGVAVVVAFPFEAVLVAAIKELPVRRFDGARKCWVVGRGSEAALAAFIAAHGVVARPEVDAWIAAAMAAPAQAAAPVASKAPNFRIEGDRVVLCAPYNADAVEPLRQVPGRRWDAARKVNTFPIAADTVAALERLAERFGWTGIETVRAAAGQVGARAAAMVAASAAAEAELPVAGLGGEGRQLRPFQAAGVRYALAADARTIIGDDMGLGKTVQALAVLHVQGAFPALVVCPKQVKGNWRREAAAWLPGRTVAVLNGVARGDWRAADVVVVNYDVLARWQPELVARGFAAVVADESHLVKNRNAARTQALTLLAKGVDLGAWQAADKDGRRALERAGRSIPVRLALTGTAVVNRPVELITQLDYLGRLNDFGGFWEFAKRYCAAYQGRYGWDLTGASNLDELARRLREICYVRREKRDVAPELPPVERSQVPVEIRDRAAYQAALADVVAWMRGRRERVEAGVQSVREYRAEALVRIEALKQLVALHKLDAVVEWVEGWLEGTREASKLVLFAHHREIQDALRERLAAYNPAWLRAEDSVEARDAQIDRFGRDSSCRVMVASLQAGGTGVNLQCADAVAFAEFGWHAAIHDQAEGRISRIGQQAESLSSYWIMAEGTFDEHVVALIEGKRELVEAINAGVGAGDDRGPSVVEWFEGLVDGLAGGAEERRAHG